MTWAVWITGRPGSGKSTIARLAAAKLAARGEAVQVLELDVLRRILTPTRRYDAAERDAVYRALVAIARCLTRAGQPVLIDATAHRRQWRDLARACIASFAEVQLLCPLDVAPEREETRAAGHHPSAIYAQAGRAGATVPGVDVPYEPARAAELTIDTTRESADHAAERVAALAERMGFGPASRATRPGWVLWISGRPGSGKTTLSAALRARLIACDVQTVVLEQRDFTALVAPDGVTSSLQRSVITRAVVAAAMLLADAGLGVLIDGAPLVRDVEALARQHIGDFALVELVCPVEVGRARERAVRWNLVPSPIEPAALGPPDLGLAYETARCPDLVLYTDVLDPSTAAREALCLISRFGIAYVRRAACGSGITT